MRASRCPRRTSASCGRKLIQQDTDGIWTEVETAAFSPVLRKPNHFQTRIEFFEQWVISKRMHGNTYVLKQRDNRGVVTALYVLDPCRVRPMVAPNGDVFYELKTDHLSGPAQDRQRLRAGARDHPRRDERALSPARRHLADQRVRPLGRARPPYPEQLGRTSSGTDRTPAACSPRRARSRMRRPRA